jgi:hypothetical protein
MRHVICIVAIVSVLLGGDAVARARCGDDPSDAAAVTAAETAVALQCSCCAPHRGYAACVTSLLRAAHRAKALPSRCVMKVRHDVAHACPAVGSPTACVLCNADSDCPADAFCECRRGSCTKTAGVCTSRPQVCPDVVAPVCGCDGTTYGNDCLRQQAGACRLHDGTCVATGGCFDTIAGQCTGRPCSPADGCPLPNEFCSPACGSPPPTGTCFDTLARKCTKEACGPDHPCLPNEFCLGTCPPPRPTGRCFVTVDEQCSAEPCGPGVPCRNPNEFCDPRCLGTTCTIDTDCGDGNPCTIDHCVSGTCEHACVCLAPDGASSCCPGPAALCVVPCGVSADGTCGGACSLDAVCTATDDGCACVSRTPTCGDTFPTCDGSCPVDSVCASVTGAPACQCMPISCVGGCPTPTPTPITDPTPRFPTPTPTLTPLPPGTYANTGGTCRWTIDCPILAFGGNGNLWPYAPNATSGAFSGGWVQWSLGPYPTAPVNTCSNFTGTSTYAELPTPRVRGTVYQFALQGSCSGVDADGKSYVLTTTQSMETYYSRGGGGKGGGGAGWKLRDTGGITTISYP